VFHFDVLAEALSHGTYSGMAGDLGWIPESSLDPSVLAQIKDLKLGDFSGIIETKVGYKIICVDDTADPGKMGQKHASYKVITTKLKYKDPISTQKDAKKIDEILENITQVNTVEKYKEVCKKYKLELNETVNFHPDEYQEELINRSKSTGNPGILESLEDPNYINILMLVSEDVPDEAIPGNKELLAKVSNKKLETEFVRNFKNMKSAANVHIYIKKLNQVFA
jgi:hypothetical protein